jgi:hypothetical protein
LKLKRHPCTSLTTGWLGRLIAAISPRWVSLESVAPKVASLYRLRFSWSLGSLAGTKDCALLYRAQPEERGFRAATDAVALPQPKPRAVSVPLVVPSVRGREIIGIQGSSVGRGEDTLQRLDFTYSPFGVHRP